MLRTNGAAMNKYIGQQFAALRYEKIFWLLKKLHLLVDAAPSTRLLHVLRQSVFATVRRGAFFYLLKGDEEYESKLHLPRLWNLLGL